MLYRQELQATQIKVDVNDLTPEKLQQYQAAQGATLQAHLGRLIAVSENYPDTNALMSFQRTYRRRLKELKTELKFQEMITILL